MVLDIKPNKMYYLIPFFILLIGGNLFYILLSNSIGSFTNIMDKINPGESIVVDVEENGKYYIMVDEFNRSDIIIYSISETTTMQIYDNDSNYLFQFLIYEEDNPSNIVIAEKLPDNTSITINNFYVVMTVRFEETGTYVIQTTSEQVNYPEFTIGLTNNNVGLMVINIFLTIGVFIGTVASSIAIYLKIHKKRIKAIYDFEHSTYRASDYPNY